MIAHAPGSLAPMWGTWMQFSWFLGWGWPRPGCYRYLWTMNQKEKLKELSLFVYLSLPCHLSATLPVRWNINICEKRIKQEIQGGHWGIAC